MASSAPARATTRRLAGVVVAGLLAVIAAKYADPTHDPRMQQ
ncbi:MAG TPA: hypothetical protein VGN51_09710 [Acidimicrobiia bacterium]